MSSAISTLLDLLTRVEFVVGFSFGIIALLSLVLIRRRRSLWGFGLALTLATVVGVNVIFERRLGLTLGLLMLAIGGWLLDRAKGKGGAGRALGPWVIIGAGALTTSLRGGLPEVAWIQLAAPVVIVFTGYWLRSWEHLPQRPYVGILVAISTFGIWATVPDTETARILLGSALPMSLATTPRVGSRLLASGAFALAGVIVGIAAVGGAGRHGSILGAWACVGLLALLPMLGRRALGIRPWMLLGGHTLFVLLAARVVGLWESALAATVGVAMLAGSAYAVLSLLVARRHTELPLGPA